jgi:signal peptidase II
MKLQYRVFTAFLIALAVDWLTKIWAERTLMLHDPVQIIGEFFRLTLGYNTGVAFGLFANGGIGPLLVTGLIIVGLAVWFVHALRASEIPPVAAWPIGLILGGAIANFVDRLPDGRVTDFLDFGLGAARWPTFNLADSFIVVGVAVLLWISMMSRHPGTDQQS